MSAKQFKQADRHVISDLAQVKILADPLRVRILELLSREEMTTKQVAGQLDEKPTKLYHHVEAMERAGLLHLTRTRQNRGTIEKYYRAVARAFTVDAGLFSETADDDSPLPEMVASVLERTGDELRALMASDSAGEMESSGLISFIEIQASAEQIDKLRKGLENLIRDTCGSCDESDDDSAERRFRLTLAFYPLDR